MCGNPNHRWIYTYDYAPGSVWEPWREADDNPDWIDREADIVVRRVRKNLTNFLLLTDSHFTYNGTWDDTVASMKALVSRMQLAGIIHLGDMTDGLLPLRETLEIEKKVIGDMEGLGIPLYPVSGNHDYNYFHGNPEVRYPDRPRYVVDLPEEGCRMIFIDSFDPNESVRYGFTEDCVHWLDMALNQMPQEYVAIVFSHVTPLVRLQAWTDNIRNREKLMEVLNRHADRILALINGHNHCDHLFNDLYNGKFPVISINCAKCEYFTDHKPEGAVVPARRLGDRTQESFDILQMDCKKRELFFTRFGAGQDRMVTGGRAHWCQ